jgi:hypothetical protein
MTWSPNNAATDVENAVWHFMLSDPRVLFGALGFTVLNVLRLFGWLATLIGLALIMRRILIKMLFIII